MPARAAPSNLTRLLIWRAGGELLFASIERRRGTEDCTGRKPFTSQARACGGGAVNFIDTSACDALLHSIKELQSQGITLAFACVGDGMHERMRLSGIETVIGSTLASTGRSLSASRRPLSGHCAGASSRRRRRAVCARTCLLVARWIELPPGAGQHFLLDTGTLCVLGYYREIPAVRVWNGPLLG